MGKDVMLSKIIFDKLLPFLLIEKTSTQCQGARYWPGAILNDPALKIEKYFMWRI